MSGPDRTELEYRSDSSVTHLDPNIEYCVMHFGALDHDGFKANTLYLVPKSEFDEKYKGKHAYMDRMLTKQVNSKLWEPLNRQLLQFENQITKLWRDVEYRAVIFKKDYLGFKAGVSYILPKYLYDKKYEQHAFEDIFSNDVIRLVQKQGTTLSAETLAQILEDNPCPIELTTITDENFIPIIANDGRTYNQKALYRHLRQIHSSPVTREEINAIFINAILCKLIVKLKNHPGKAIDLTELLQDFDQTKHLKDIQSPRVPVITPSQTTQPNTSTYDEEADNQAKAAFFKRFGIEMAVMMPLFIGICFIPGVNMTLLGALLFTVAAVAVIVAVEVIRHKLIQRTEAATQDATVDEVILVKQQAQQPSALSRFLMEIEQSLETHFRSSVDHPNGIRATFDPEGFAAHSQPPIAFRVSGAHDALLAQAPANDSNSLSAPLPANDSDGYQKIYARDDSALRERPVNPVAVSPYKEMGDSPADTSELIPRLKI